MKVQVEIRWRDAMPHGESERSKSVAHLPLEQFPLISHSAPEVEFIIETLVI